MISSYLEINIGIQAFYCSLRQFDRLKITAQNYCNSPTSMMKLFYLILLLIILPFLLYTHAGSTLLIFLRLLITSRFIMVKI